MDHQVNSTFITYHVYGNFSDENPEYTPGVKPVHSVIIGIFISVWIVTVNVLLITAILSSRVLRSRPSSWLLLNLAVADLLVGVIITPLSTYYEMRQVWDLGHHMCMAWLSMDILLSCVSLLALLMINVDRLIFLLLPVQYPNKVTWCAIYSMVMICWLGCLVMVLPFFFAGQASAGYDTIIPHMCFMEMTQLYTIGSAISVYFVPATCVVALNIAIMVIYCIKTKQVHVTTNSSYLPHHRRRKMTSVMCTMSVVNALYIIMWLPFFLFSVLFAIGHHDLVSSQVIYVTIWIAYANSGVNPLLWLMYKDIRTVYVDMLRCLCRRHSEQANYCVDTDDYTNPQITVLQPLT